MKLWNNLWLLKGPLLTLLILQCVGEKADQDTNICPSLCTCLGQPLHIYEDIYTVNCSAINFTAIPKLLPSAAVEMFFSHNAIKSIQTDALSGFYKLKKLYLNHNQIVDIKRNIFGKNEAKKLHVLDLSANSLTEVPKELPSNIKILHLSNNKITVLDGSHFVSATKLTELYLHGNQISTLNGNSFKCNMVTPGNDNYLLSVRKLTLDKNKISTVTGSVFERLVDLEGLTITHNALSEINTDNFKGLLSLKYLDLSHNSIKSVTKFSFRDLPKLKYLYLAHNYLQTLPEGLPMMEWLDISYNNISRIDEENKGDLYPIEIFNLAHNPLICDCGLLWLKELYDRREYILKHIDVEAGQFVPTCAAPRHLKGDSWDVLGDDVFDCQESLNLADLYKRQFNDGNQEELANIRTKLSVTIGHIEHDEITVQWSFENEDVSFYRVYVHYYLFGKREDTQQFALVKAAKESYDIQNLTENTNYVICVVPALHKENSVPISLENCVEATTSQRKLSTFEKYIYPAWSYLVASLTVFISVFSLIGFVSILYAGWSMKKPDWSAEYTPLSSSRLSTQEEEPSASQQELSTSQQEPLVNGSAAKQSQGDSIVKRICHSDTSADSSVKLEEEDKHPHSD